MSPELGAAVKHWDDARTRLAQKIDQEQQAAAAERDAARERQLAQFEADADAREQRDEELRFRETALQTVLLKVRMCDQARATHALDKHGFNPNLAVWRCRYECADGLLPFEAEMDRCAGLVCSECGCTPAEAATALEEAEGDIQTAVACIRDRRQREAAETITPWSVAEMDPTVARLPLAMAKQICEWLNEQFPMAQYPASFEPQSYQAEGGPAGLYSINASICYEDPGWPGADAFYRIVEQGSRTHRWCPPHQSIPISVGLHGIAMQRRDSA